MKAIESGKRTETPADFPDVTMILCRGKFSVDAGSRCIKRGEWPARIISMRANRFAITMLVAALISLAALPLPAMANPRWQQVPPTPTMPMPRRQGYAPVNDIKMYFAIFGSGSPVILIHGGLANSDYWGNQVPALARHYEVIVADSRGHGRSTRSAQPFSYGLMASDVMALMDFLGIKRAAIVGWSDGGIIGLDLAIHHPERLTKLFAFAANYNPAGVRSDIGSSTTFNAFIARCGIDYQRLSPTPGQYKEFLAAIQKMWATEPNYSREQLEHINVPVVIADGDHDEAIDRKQTEQMAALIPNAGLLIEPGVSHFSMLQDPQQFNEDVMHFLAHWQ
jgi:pimeloyl-ACP methyl ester carboxylesterase